MPTSLGEDGTVLLTGCDWTDCEHSDVLVQIGKYVWCPCHMTDDLASLKSGPRSVCVVCTGIVIWWLDDKPVHQSCLRWLLMRSDSRAQEPMTPRGAYGRRTR